MAAAVSLVDALTVWKPRAKDLARAEDDLEWWHNGRESELGAHACGFEPGSAFDTEAIDCRDGTRILNVRSMRVAFGRSRAVRRHFAVAPLLGSLSPLQQRQSLWIYASRPYPVHLRIAWACDRNRPGVVTLVGAALRTTAIRSAFARAHGGKSAETTGELLTWADEATRPSVERGRIVRQQLPKWAAMARDEALTMREDLLTAYAVARRAQWREAYVV